MGFPELSRDDNERRTVVTLALATLRQLPYKRLPSEVRIDGWLAFRRFVTTSSREGARLTIDMRRACSHAWRMSSMIQIRNVPVALHRRLKARAAMAGMSLSDYLLGEIRETAERPTLEELRARLACRSAASASIEPADAVRAERDSR